MAALAVTRATAGKEQRLRWQRQRRERGLTAPGSASKPRAPPPPRPRDWPRLLRPPPGSSWVHQPGGRGISPPIGPSDTSPAHPSAHSLAGEWRVRGGCHGERKKLSARVSWCLNASLHLPSLSWTNPAGGNRIGTGQALTRGDPKTMNCNRHGRICRGFKGALSTHWIHSLVSKCDDVGGKGLVVVKRGQGVSVCQKRK